jgi:hypothetical protein
MFLITLEENPDGVYSTLDEEGNHVIYFFEEEDDAERYLGLLEATNNDLPSLMINEVDSRVGVGMCELRGMKYTIIQSDDIIVPPRDYDYIQNH